MEKHFLRKSIDLIIPIFNEALSLDRLLNDIQTKLSDQFNIIIIFVDDGSIDDTPNIINILRSKYNKVQIKYIRLARNFGKEIAVKCGVDHSSSDYCVIMDGDLQHPTNKVIEAYEKIIEDNYNIVHITKKDKNSGPFSRLYRYLFNKLINRLSEYKIFLTDFMLMDKKAALSFKQFNESDFYTRGIISLVGLKKTEIFYYPNERKYGKTKFNFVRLIKLSIDAVISVSTKPLRLSIYLGMLISSISFLYGLFILFEKLLIGQPIPGFTTLSIGLFFLGGIQLLFLGIIGEYVGKTFIQSKRRPIYLIDFMVDCE